MGLYVDRNTWRDKDTRKYLCYCHLISDQSDEELHDFAESIGIRRSAFHGNHYDLRDEKLYQKALDKGAISVSCGELVNIMIQRQTRDAKKAGEAGA